MSWGRSPSSTATSTAPAARRGWPADSVNFLLVGVDDGHGTDLREMLESGDWTPGVFRSDTIMVLHLNEDRSAAQLVSIPRDSYVPIEGHGTTKINASFSYGGPDLLAKTVEDYTGIYLDHIAVIDLDGFAGVTKAIGGVDVYVPQTVTNTITDDSWTKGTHHLEGDEALRYVRQRYGLPGGDFDRIQRQQNFLRSVLDKVVSNGVLANPFKLTSLVRELSSLLVVDDEFSAGTMRSMALSSRGLRTARHPLRHRSLRRHANHRRGQRGHPRPGRDSGHVQGHRTRRVRVLLRQP